jgi:hypothetical protein
VSISAILEISTGIYACTILIELFVRKRWSSFALQAVALLGMVGLALLVNGATTGRVAFGQGTSTVATVAIMFVATALGIAARYVFYLQKSQFSLLDFLKPIVISPIVLLPLIGTLQTTSELNGTQIVSFAVLAFQNGFFWQAVLASAKPAT